MDWRWTFFNVLGVFAGLACYWSLVFGFLYCFIHWFLWDGDIAGITAIIAPLLLGLVFLGIMALREHRHEIAQRGNVLKEALSSVPTAR